MKVDDLAQKARQWFEEHWIAPYMSVVLLSESTYLFSPVILAMIVISMVICYCYPQNRLTSRSFSSKSTLAIWPATQELLLPHSSQLEAPRLFLMLQYAHYLSFDKLGKS